MATSHSQDVVPNHLAVDPKELVRFDSARASPEPDAFQQLVRDINVILGPSNGIDSESVDVEELKSIMRGYTSNQDEWDRFAFADYTRGYTRNLIDRGNGKANLLLLVWTPGKGSPIHDHANAHCVMKILKGKLNETIYSWPCQRGQSSTDPTTTSGCHGTEHVCGAAQGQPLEPNALQITRDTIYEAGQVAYMSDKIGLHRVMNPSATEPAVSLHLYTPPNAAKHGCHIFNESTGKKSHVAQHHFYSELGVKM